ncbi:GNAT family N-acetyltransferase [Luteipulveratus halotolerans]|uniref:GNAT family N-acetyltransferase n=1 Tax=Luteipulveratus halotolerans TaxID=1631356 RepID=UPI0006832D1E|nr:GNAT family N-acetyltransferase [Luteipulveratus halotolerans]
MAVTLEPLAAEAYDAWRAGVVRRLAELRYRHCTADPAAATALAEAQLARVLPDGLASADAHVRSVVRDGTRLGALCWLLVGGGEQATVLDVALDDTSDAGAVRAALIDEVRAAGARSLGAGVFAGDPVSTAFAAGDGFTVRATTMRLDLTGDPVADDGRVELRRMTPEEFATFIADEERSYTEARIKAGDSPQVARTTARQQFAALVPDGQNSAGQQFWTAYDGVTRVGLLWVDVSQPRAFVYYVEVDEAQRRRGYGAAIMTAGAAWCQRQGSIALGLNVFGYNTGARALYDGLGYVVTEDSVASDL